MVIPPTEWLPFGLFPGFVLDFASLEFWLFPAETTSWKIKTIHHYCWQLMIFIITFKSPTNKLNNSTLSTVHKQVGTTQKVLVDLVNISSKRTWPEIELSATDKWICYQFLTVLCQNRSQKICFSVKTRAWSSKMSSSPTSKMKRFFALKNPLLSCFFLPP